MARTGTAYNNFLHLAQPTNQSTDDNGETYLRTFAMKNSILIVLLSVFLSNSLKAQTSLTNTGILYVSTSSDILYVTGNVTNNSSASLTNNGNLYVRGNLTNNQASMSTGTGTLYLNGSSAQAVGGTEPFKTYHLNTNNTSGGIAINNNLSVSGTHTFTSGMLTTAASKYLIYEDNATHTGAADAAHVNGWVKKTGDDNFTFPVGNNSYLREIAISDLSSSSEYNAQYSGTTPNTANKQSPLVSVNPNEHWTMEKISGTGNITVTLNWDNSKVTFPNYVLADLRTAQYTSSNWTNAGASNVTGNVTTNGTITSDPFIITGAIPLSIASVTTIVPLDFLSITAKRKQGFTDVEWHTANEMDVKEHQVQRSSNAFSFVTVGKIPAINTSEDHVYNFYDSDNVYGLVYYRIKSVDYDGTIKYSKVVSVSNNNPSENITLKNNPVMGTIYLSLSSANPSSFNYQLIATSGSIAQQGNIQYGGTGSLAINLQPNIAAGSYILVMNDGRILFTQKIIVQ